MKVVVLAGGEGTRMREETEFRPKPMVMLGNQPILWHIMSRYAAHGFKDFVICLGYKGEMIKRYFANYDLESTDFTIDLGMPAPGNITWHRSPQVRPDWRVTLVDTGLKSMTGSRVKQIEQFIDTDNFMVTYGDGLADVDLPALVSFHRAHGKIGTVTAVRPPSRFGELQPDADRVAVFSEKPQVSSSYISGGFFVFRRAVFDYLSEEESCNLERGPLDRLAKDGELMMFRHDRFWQCVDTVRELNILREMYETGSAPWLPHGEGSQ